MENKAIFVTVFTFAAILVSFSIGNAFTQNTTAIYPNDTETVQEFEGIEGNNGPVNLGMNLLLVMVNDLEDSLSINENESN